MSKSFFSYSIAKKFIQAVSGAFLVIFLLLHVTINLFSVIDAVSGNFQVAADEELFSAGDGLFKWGCDFMSTPIISIMVPVLALGFLIHILYGLYLSVLNTKAVGGMKRYASGSKGKADSWSAKNMVVLGVVILGFIAFHLFHFWAKMQLPELLGINEEAYQDNPYILLATTFSNPVVLALYTIWFIFVGLHLTHGFWSMFQTVGWSGQIWMKRLKVIGFVVAWLIVLGFITVAFCAYLNADQMMLQAGQTLPECACCCG